MIKKPIPNMSNIFDYLTKYVFLKNHPKKLKYFGDFF